MVVMLAVGVGVANTLRATIGAPWGAWHMRVEALFMPHNRTLHVLRSWDASTPSMFGCRWCECAILLAGAALECTLHATAVCSAVPVDCCLLGGERDTVPC